jgi:hypothetical protein
MALQATMQRRSRQMSDRRLQRIETIVERQERLPPESNDDRLFSSTESTVDFASFGPVG